MSDPLRMAIIGAGWFGREAHLANLTRMDDVELVAACSNDESDRAKVKAAAPSVEVAADWQEIVQRPDLDAVIVSVPNYLHCEVAVAAFEAGKHVFCEKPLGLNVEQCDRIIAAAERAGKVLQVGHEMRYQRLYRHMRELVDRGQIGSVQLMWCREFRGPMRLGWRASESLTGGTLLEKNCHHFDLFNWFLGRPLRVAAIGGRNVLVDREVFDNAMVIVEYEGGRRAVLELCLFAPYGGEIEIGVAGDRGRIDTYSQAWRLTLQRFDVDERLELAVGEDPVEAAFVDAAGQVNRGVYAELREFIHCCRMGERPLVDGQAGRASVAVSVAAQESIRSGQVVTLEL
jgi:predicted dehydrogenase